MGQDDGGEQQLQRNGALWAKQEEAVDHMERNPADCEEKKNEEERRGHLHLLAHGGCRPALSLPSFTFLSRDAPHLLLHREEDLGVDEEHDEQRCEHASEEVEVDHVGHVHHQDEEAVAGIWRSLVPAHQGDQADEGGQQPRAEDHHQGVPRRHQDAVTQRHEDGDITLHSHCQQAEDGALGEHYQHAEH